METMSLLILEFTIGIEGNRESRKTEKETLKFKLVGNKYYYMFK